MKGNIVCRDGNFKIDECLHRTELIIQLLVKNMGSSHCRENGRFLFRVVLDICGDKCYQWLIMASIQNLHINVVHGGKNRCCGLWQQTLNMPRNCLGGNFTSKGVNKMVDIGYSNS